jgi:hypothetical protein
MKSPDAPGLAGLSYRGAVMAFIDAYETLPAHGGMVGRLFPNPRPAPVPEASREKQDLILFIFPGDIITG